MILGNDYVDLAPLFSAHSTRNYLLSTLDFTDSVGVTDLPPRLDTTLS